MPTSPESGFRGFPADALDFYAGLAKDNTKAYWERRKPTYENSVRAPMEALLGSLPDGFPPFRLMRPYRDVRFTKDKSLYKTECGASGWTDGGAGYYLGLSADGFLVGGGIYQLGRDQLERFRAAVDDRVERIGPGAAGRAGRGGAAGRRTRHGAAPEDGTAGLPEGTPSAGAAAMEGLCRHGLDQEQARHRIGPAGELGRRPAGSQQAADGTGSASTSDRRRRTAGPARPLTPAPPRP